MSWLFVAQGNGTASSRLLGETSLIIREVRDNVAIDEILELVCSERCLTT